jgi:hypothetical protein
MAPSQLEKIFTFTEDMLHYSQKDRQFLFDAAVAHGVHITLSDELESYNVSWELEHDIISETRPIQTDINLTTGEQCYIQCMSEWRQPRTTKETFGFVGGSINGFFGGVPLTYEHSELAELSHGSLYITDKRIVFIGDVKSTNVTLGQIAKIEMFSDALKVNKISGKPDVFMLPSRNNSTIICSTLIDLGYLSAA